MRTPLNALSLNLERGVYVIEFYARWCGTCRTVSQSLSELEDEMSFSGIMIDVELLPVVARNFLVRGVPVIVLLQDGFELGRISGSYTKQEIRTWLLGFNVI